MKTGAPCSWERTQRSAGGVDKNSPFTVPSDREPGRGHRSL